MKKKEKRQDSDEKRRSAKSNIVERRGLSLEHNFNGTEAAESIGRRNLVWLARSVVGNRLRVYSHRQDKNSVKGS